MEVFIDRVHGFKATALSSTSQEQEWEINTEFIHESKPFSSQHVLQSLLKIVSADLRGKMKIA